MTEKDQQQLEATLNELAENKHDFISEEALEAKVKFDEVKGSLETQNLNFADEDEEFQHSFMDIDAFNDNVKLLLSVFKQSKFEEFIHLLGRPQRLYAIQLFMGFFKGAGFVLGVIFILAVISFVFGQANLVAALG